MMNLNNNIIDVGNNSIPTIYSDDATIETTLSETSADSGYDNNCMDSSDNNDDSDCNSSIYDSFKANVQNEDIIPLINENNIHDSLPTIWEDGNNTQMIVENSLNETTMESDCDNDCIGCADDSSDSLQTVMWLDKSESSRALIKNLLMGEYEKC